MPEKNPEILSALWAWLIANWNSGHHQACGFMSGVIVAYFRALYYGKEGSFSKRFAEGIVCGAIAATVYPILSKIGLDEAILPFIGTILGLLGLDFILKNTKGFVDKWLKDKTKGKGDENTRP